MERSSLLSLPAEVVEIIMGHLDPAAFYVSSLTCTHLHSAAKNSRRNIAYHFDKLPGIRRPAHQLLHTDDLFFVFCQRVVDSFCAAGVLADAKLFIPTHHPSQPDVSISQTVRKSNVPATKISGVEGIHNNKMSKAVFSLESAGPPRVLARVDENENISMYVLADEGVTLIAQLRDMLPDALDRSDLVVVKMAFSLNRDLAVLYKPRNRVERTTQLVSPFVEAFPPIATMRLVTFKCEDVAGQGFSYSSSSQETRDLDFVMADAVGLAIAPNGIACISWNPPLRTIRTEFWLVGRNAAKMRTSKYG